MVSAGDQRRSAAVRFSVSTHSCVLLFITVSLCYTCTLQLLISFPRSYVCYSIHFEPDTLLKCFFSYVAALLSLLSFFFFNNPAPPDISPFPLRAALPI